MARKFNLLIALKKHTEKTYFLLEKRLIRLCRPQQTLGTVFLSGVQRSGTNSIMTVLERSWDADVLMEHDPRAFDNYIMRNERTISKITKSSRAQYVVIKALHEAHDLIRLMDVFAPSKVIWVFRHYDDVVNSMLSHWPGWRDKIDEIILKSSEGDWRAKGMSVDTRSVLEEHYKPGMNDASAQALFWFYRNQLFFDQQLDRNPSAYMVRYESIVSQPDIYVKDLADFVGISCSQAMIKVLNSGSVKKAASPPIDENVQAICKKMLDRLNASFEQQQKIHKSADRMNAVLETS